MLRLNTAPIERVLARTQNHMYLRAHPGLAQVVAHYTITFPSVGQGAQYPALQGIDNATLTILPDVSGCLVFDVGSGAGWFWGATTKAMVVEKDFEDVPMRFFIELLPGGANYIFGLYMAEFTNITVEIADILPKMFSQFAPVLVQATDISSLLMAVDSILLQMTQRADAPSSVAGLLRFIQGEKSHSVQGLAQRAGYSTRHLNRLFNQMMGVPVKKYVQVLRFNQFLAGLAPGVSLTHLAHSTGYYDQSHLNHDFKAVCGVSPSEYLAGMSGFYREKFKF